MHARPVHCELGYSNPTTAAATGPCTISKAIDGWVGNNDPSEGRLAEPCCCTILCQALINDHKRCTTYAKRNNMHAPACEMVTFRMDVAQGQLEPTAVTYILNAACH